ncbi:hypothetical protein NL108_000480 [Boleophthalmus pectinirostris]|nr:hypothetical protein NL108_000480 [Boleophthalmus pectinirostris]
METTCAGPEKRQLESPPLKGALGKRTKPNENSSFEAIMSAITQLTVRFEKQEEALRENSIIVSSLAKSLEFHAAELKDCKGQVSALETKVEILEKENLVLRQTTTEQESYSRHWNLRIKGMKEKPNENIREKVVNLLQKVAPHWARIMEEAVDTVHRNGRKEEKRTRPVIIQFVKRQHQVGIWKLTKESTICKEAGVHFTEDLTVAARQAREVLWPKIQEAKKAGKKAYFRGPFGFIDGQKI